MSSAFGVDSDAYPYNRWPFHTHHLLWAFSGQQENGNINRDVLQTMSTSLFSSEERRKIESFEDNSKSSIFSAEVSPGDNYNVFDYSDLLLRNTTPKLFNGSLNTTQSSTNAVDDDIEFYYFYKNLNELEEIELESNVLCSDGEMNTQTVGRTANIAFMKHKRDLYMSGKDSESQRLRVLLLDYCRKQTLKTEQLTFLWIIFVMIVFGNCSVLAALITSKNRKTRMNFFIMHLAIADLMVGLINVLTDIVWRTTVGFYAGNIACKVVKFSQVLVTYSSTYVLVSLSIDRYDAITHPLNFSGSWKRAKILVATAWGLSSLFSIPAIFLNEEEIIKGHPQCWINLKPWQWQLYITLVALSLFFVPAVVIASCYSIIVHTIWNKSRTTAFAKSASKYQNKKQSNAERNSQNSVSARLEEESVCERSSSRGVIPRAKIKTVKMTFVIVFVFILCWSPYFVWDLLQVYGFIPNTQTTIALSTFIQSLAPLNSAANPLIYCLFSTRVFRNLRKRPFYTWIVSTFCCCIPRLQRDYGRDTLHGEFAGTLTTQTLSSRTSASQNRDVSLTTRQSCTNKLSKQRPMFASETNFERKGT